MTLQAHRGMHGKVRGRTPAPSDRPCGHSRAARRLLGVRCTCHRIDRGAPGDVCAAPDAGPASHDQAGRMIVSVSGMRPQFRSVDSCVDVCFQSIRGER